MIQQLRSGRCTAGRVLFPVLAVLLGLAPAAVGWAQSNTRQESAFPQNSTSKKRVEPDEVAARAGTAIRWNTEFELAREQSMMSGKPLFWYVPTVAGTFMDRKPVIDRYMLAGIFSWPAIVNLINERFVPLRLKPGAGEAEKYGLEPYRFVEPGFVVLSAEGELLGKFDRLTTQHPQWLYSRIAGLVGEAKTWSQMAGEPGREGLDGVWKLLVESDWSAEIPGSFQPVAGTEMELELLRGIQQHRRGQQQKAAETWRSASRLYPDHPLAWKAAMEAQGIGPIGRGFEVFSILPEKAWRAGLDSAGSAAPEATWSEQELWTRSAAFLVGMQAESGGYFDSDYDFGGFDSLANVHVAVTALVGMALLEAQPRITDAALRQRIGGSMERALAFCLDDSRINPLDRDEILWAEAYRVRFAAAANRASGDGRYSAETARLAKRLENLQLNNGSWFHEYPNAFVTATALIALRDARDLAGVTLDDSRVNLGLKRLENQRFANGAWPYGTRREGEENPRRIEPVPASAGRIPLCELARFRWGAVSSEELARAAATGIEHHELLAKALKYDNHTSTYAYGGFFFWYDMQARSEAIAAIADTATRQALAEKQRNLILSLPEIDGCFIDSHELGRCYGTAMALLSLSLVEQPSRE